MYAYRKTSIIVGILFIIATAFGIASLPFSSILNDSNYLIKAADYEYQIIISVLFQIIMSFACAGIAIGLYPILKKYNQALSIGSVSFRIMEAIFHIISAICLLILLKLSQEYIKAGVQEILNFKTIGTLLLITRDNTSNLGLISWHLGALMYYYIFYKSKLIPRWLSGWGIIGILLAILSSILLLFNLLTQTSHIHTAMNVPIAFQEMFFAIWLIVKGFDSAKIGSESSMNK